MAHFAKISSENKVLQVLVINNNDTLDADGIQSEAIGQQFLETLNDWPAEMWVKTSYNTYQSQHANGGTPFRGNYAGTGMTWSESDQIFWAPKPYASWVKHNASASWKSPIGDAPTLTEEQTSQNTASTHRWDYVWNEETTAWDLTNLKI